MRMLICVVNNIYKDQSAVLVFDVIIRPNASSIVSYTAYCRLSIMRIIVRVLMSSFHASTHEFGADYRPGISNTRLAYFAN